MPPTATPPPSPGAFPSRFGDVATALPVVLAAGAPTWWLLGRPATYPLATAALAVGLGVLVLVQLPARHPGPGIGAANRVTLGRAALALPVLALGALSLLLPGDAGSGGGAAGVWPVGPPEARPLPDAAAWWVILASTVAMLLDGLDGRVARRTGTESSFGARFDMELDAGLIMALAVLAWGSGKVGPWVLLIGLMRYAFIAAGWVLPALTGSLPESFRRKVVCVVQGVVLLVALGPIVPESLAVAVSAVGLIALTWSFAVDVRWLLSAR